MKKTQIILLAIGLIDVVGCGPNSLPSGSSDGPRALPINGSDIVKVVIHEYNWENGITTTYSVETDQVTVSDDRGMTSRRTVTLTDAQSMEIRDLFDGINHLYPGEYKNEDVFDGVIIRFDFHLKDGSLVKTSLKNIRIESYASLTMYVSSIVRPEIQYHQYRMKGL